MVEDLNLLEVGRSRPEEVKWVSFDGTPSPGGMTSTKGPLEDIDRVLAGEGRSINSLSFRDPESFRAGGVHAHKELWQSLASGCKNELEVKEWISRGVEVQSFLRPFKGVFRGEKYDSPMPPQKVFKNHPS